MIDDEFGIFGPYEVPSPKRKRWVRIIPMILGTMLFAGLLFSLRQKR